MDPDPCVGFLYASLKAVVVMIDKTLSAWQLQKVLGLLLYDILI